MTQSFDERFQGGVGLQGKGVPHLRATTVIRECFVNLVQHCVEEQTGMVDIQVNFKAGKVVWSGPEAKMG